MEDSPRFYVAARYTWEGLSCSHCDTQLVLDLGQIRTHYFRNHPDITALCMMQGLSLYWRAEGKGMSQTHIEEDDDVREKSYSGLLIGESEWAGPFVLGE